MKPITTFQMQISKKYLIWCLWLKTCLEVKILMPLNEIRCRGVREILSSGLGIFLLALVAGTAQGQTLLSQTTWGGTGSDVARGVAVAPDGSSYVVGLSDSFTVDQFGNPRPAIALVKFTSERIPGLAKDMDGTPVRSWPGRGRRRRRGVCVRHYAHEWR
ncbi:hypothetical protein LP416_23100 [Polaromonas sp. P2-4]|nr:hypothetical protein LP416_23100 [Polaromonas sp. P2-4]